MPDSRPPDHPAQGVAHLFLPGNADSLVAAAAFVRRSGGFGWVTVAREHRLPVLLERPMTASASELWCLGYSGTASPQLSAALDAQAAERPVYWLTGTSGRLRSVGGGASAVRTHNLPGGSLVPQVLSLQGQERLSQDRELERLGYLLCRYPGAPPQDGELALVNRLHAASVQVRNQERSGGTLVRELASIPVRGWSEAPVLAELAASGEERIRRSRRALAARPPTLATTDGPAIWIVPPGLIDRGAHGKALAARCVRRRQPTVLIEEPRRGRWTKAWVVLPADRAELWPWIMQEAARVSDDFSYTGLRGAGALPTGQEQDFADALWPILLR